MRCVKRHMPNEPDEPADVATFPFSKSRPRTVGKDLGLSAMAQKHVGAQPGLKGHWCSNCKGIWYGYVGEVECPVCGNRQG